MKNPRVDAREKGALDSLLRDMVTEFRDHPKPSDYMEASQLSEITEKEQYEDLIKAFINEVIVSAGNARVVDRDLLPAFDRALRQHRNRSSEHFLTFPLDELRSGLRSAIKKADLQSQYYFLHVLCTVLDVAVDIRLEGIDRDTIHHWLFQTLHDLKDHDDSRIAQAAAYAYEALRSVPDNEGLMDVFLRTSSAGISATAKLAGSVASMDPTKALDAVPNILELVGYFGTVLDSLQTIVRTPRELSDAFLQDIEGIPKQRL